LVNPENEKKLNDSPVRISAGQTTNPSLFACAL